MRLDGGTHGLQRHGLRAGPFIVSTTEHRPHFTVGRHAHERASVNVVLGGVYQETFRGETLGFRPSTFLAKPPGEVHSNGFGVEGAQCLLIEVADERMLATFADLFERPLTSAAAAARGEYLQIVRELDARDPLAPLAVESGVLQLLVLKSRRRGRLYRSEPLWMNRTLELLQETSGANLSLSDLAALVGVHPVHLARSFRATQGVSVGAYKRRVRVERAIGLLTGSTLALSQIAAEVGFYDQSHMGRLIKRATGFTPAELRRPRR